MYKLQGNFNVPMILLKPEIVTVKGSPKKQYNEEFIFFGSFRTFGGTEKVINDVLMIENTAIIECWFDARITSDCQVKVGNRIYEILGQPENIEMRNQVLKFKIREFKGGA